MSACKPAWWCRVRCIVHWGFISLFFGDGTTCDKATKEKDGQSVQQR